MNQLILGDNLEILKNTNSESVDLIYIDPPFFSNRTYEVIWGDKGEVRSFEDRFSGGIDHYIGWLKDRVLEMHRILKPTGSIFIHCDWHANAYIRVQILDKIFGGNNFRNEIIWKRNFTKKGSQFKMAKLATNTDSIFYYVKSDKATFLTPKINGSMEELLLRYDKEDENNRRFKSEPIELPRMMARENLIYEYKNYTPKYGWMMVREKLEELDKQGKLYFTKNGKPRRKNFLDEYGGSEADNIWLDITPVGQNQSEIIGYPTQKPEALLERIIKCASNEGDTVMDCFMGGGTTIAVADKLNRKWIGIDQSVQAVSVTELRLNLQQGKATGKIQDIFAKPFTKKLYKYDYDTLRYKDAFEFENWVVMAFGGIPNVKQRGDLGLDGRTKENQPIQVKRSDNIGRNVVDNFLSAVQRYDKASFERNKAEGKPIGFIIAFSFNKGAVQEVARLRNDENMLIKLVTVEEIVPIAKKPNLKIEMIDKGTKQNLREIEFVASAESETGIHFFAWDFSYRESFVPEILFDKVGKQTYLFKVGEHKIAVKVVDGEGLESIEVVHLKINGMIERK
jgi:DNA modification methylase